MSPHPSLPPLPSFLHCTSPNSYLSQGGGRASWDLSPSPSRSSRYSTHIIPGMVAVTGTERASPGTSGLLSSYTCLPWSGKVQAMRCGHPRRDVDVCVVVLCHWHFCSPATVATPPSATISVLVPSTSQSQLISQVRDFPQSPMGGHPRARATVEVTHV